MEIFFIFKKFHVVDSQNYHVESAEKCINRCCVFIFKDYLYFFIEI